MAEGDDNHGIAAAYYSSDGVRYRPVMECSCGFHTGRDSISWEEAGAVFDEHLSDVGKSEQ